jgi:hypothetical protein
MTCEVGFVLAGLGVGNTIEYQHKLIRLLKGWEGSFVTTGTANIQCNQRLHSVSELQLHNRQSHHRTRK